MTEYIKKSDVLELMKLPKELVAEYVYELKGVWLDVAEQTDPSNSEKPNNCEPTWEQVKEYCNKRCLDIVDSGFVQYLYNKQTEPSEDWICNTCKYHTIERAVQCKMCGDGGQYEPKTEQTEPQTERSDP